MNIIVSSAYMKSDISMNSLLETECLFGETVEIYETQKDSVYCKLLTDNYCGWIKKNKLGNLDNATYRVLSTRTYIYKEPNEKSETSLYLPLGSKLCIGKIISNWAEIHYLTENKVQVGYVPSKHIVSCEHKVFDWVTIAEQLEGVPYRWGGRDTIGIDCSALLQLSYQTYGQIIPRNTSEQIKLSKPIIYKIKDLKRGCVVFWEGHVGIMIDELNCIHANAFHMKTIVEPLINIIERMDKKNNILKMMDFN